jgi:hypothetical protein
MGVLIFPHPDLMVIVGKPTNTTVQLLKRQLYTNARSVTSPRGGGNNGHLAMLMSDAAYLLRAGEAFAIPLHPGVTSVHVAGATAAQIAETIRLFNQNLKEHALYNEVATALKAHAVDNTYIRELEDATFGFADVTPHAMLDHLDTTYAVLTPEALETNRTSLSDGWNPDELLENLWRKIIEVQRIATSGGAPITDVAAITLTLAMFKKSGLLGTTTQQWRVCPVAQWTFATFKSDFTLANTERIQQTTAAGATDTMVPTPLTLSLLDLPSRLLSTSPSLMKSSTPPVLTPLSTSKVVDFTTVGPTD